MLQFARVKSAHKPHEKIGSCFCIPLYSGMQKKKMAISISVITLVFPIDMLDGINMLEGIWYLI